jgi:hypothetical protein
MRACDETASTWFSIRERGYMDRLVAMGSAAQEWGCHILDHARPLAPSDTIDTTEHGNYRKHTTTHGTTNDSIPRAG